MALLLYRTCGPNREVLDAVGIPRTGTEQDARAIRAEKLSQTPRRAQLNGSTAVPYVRRSTGVTYMTDPSGAYALWGLRVEWAPWSGGRFDLSVDTEPPTLIASFDRPVAAFIFDAYADASDAFDVQVHGSSGGLFSALHRGLSHRQPVTVLQFFGFRSPASNVGSFVLDSNSPRYGFAIDNFSIGGDSANVVTPEPATLVLAATGLLAFGRRRRRAFEERVNLCSGGSWLVVALF